MAEMPSDKPAPAKQERKDLFPLPWVLISILIYILLQMAYLVFFSGR
ncbi:MAG: hypothetical protein Q7P63_00475 [Verrucomicrobiota bacterium JB022]|nr:hypothetical protein [Verrucomicrobiota bacterium JB022]